MAWERIRGQGNALRQLFSAHARGRLAHAFLFAGPRGVGKHLVATELAKALLCDRPPAPLTPCDHCPSCLQVMAGTHPDSFAVRTPDDKHELPVELMQEFTARLGLKPARGFRRIGIVQDADDFNEASANSFLKTLEEPPPGSVLILLGSTPDLQLSTIRSRCQVVRFEPLRPADLEAVLADHGITDRGRVERLIRLAGGSPGQALALNDDALWSFRETLVNLLTAPKPDPVRFAAEWTRFVEQAGKESAAKRQRASLTVRLLMEPLRAALRVAAGGSDESADAGERPGIRQFAGRSGPEHLAHLLEACANADYLIDRRVQLELVIDSLADELCRSPVGID